MLKPSLPKLLFYTTLSLLTVAMAQLAYGDENQSIQDSQNTKSTRETQNTSKDKGKEDIAQNTTPAYMQKLHRGDWDYRENWRYNRTPYLNDVNQSYYNQWMVPEYGYGSNAPTSGYDMHRNLDGYNTTNTSPYYQRDYGTNYYNTNLGYTPQYDGSYAANPYPSSIYRNNYYGDYRRDYYNRNPNSVGTYNTYYDSISPRTSYPMYYSTTPSPRGTYPRYYNTTTLPRGSYYGSYSGTYPSTYYNTNAITNPYPNLYYNTYGVSGYSYPSSTYSAGTYSSTYYNTNSLSGSTNPYYNAQAPNASFNFEFPSHTDMPYTPGPSMY